MKRGLSGLVLLLVLGMAGTGWAASPRAGSAPSAAVAGIVRDAHGTPQMGALVQLLAADASVIASAMTDDRGRYLIQAVLPGRYQLRASAAFLVPALRPNLRLQPGAEAIVNLTMNTLFEVENWLPTQKRGADEPADDWKWTLRSTANRPLLRVVDSNGNEIEVSSSASEQHRAQSQARVQVTSGDGAFGEGGVHQVLILNRTMENADSAIFWANVGDPTPGFPLQPSLETAAGYERRSPLGGSTRMVTSYQSHPEVVDGAGAGLQVIRLASTEQINLGDAMMIDAGTLLEAERLEANRLSSRPFVRVSLRPATGLMLEYRYATGRALQSSDDLDEVRPPLDTVADGNGRPVNTAASHHELAAHQKLGTRVLSAAVYQDEMDRALLAGSGRLDASDLRGLAVLADPTTGTFRVAGPGYTGRGLSVSLAQKLTPALSASVQYDLGTALRTQATTPLALADFTAGLRAHTISAGTVSLHGKIIRSGTALKAEYRFQPSRTLTAVNAYNTGQDEAFLGFCLRQRLYLGHLLPGGVDAVVQATNLLEQGYRPVLAPDGHTLFLAQVPRAVQGGLAFNF